MRRTDRHADRQAVRQRSRETETQSDRGSDIPNVNGSFLMLPKFLLTCTRVQAFDPNRLCSVLCYVASLGIIQLLFESAANSNRLLSSLPSESIQCHSKTLQTKPQGTKLCSIWSYASDRLLLHATHTQTHTHSADEHQEHVCYFPMKLILLHA